MGGRIIKMADLRECLEKAGLTGVETVLQSGNVLFSGEQAPPALKTIIERALAAAFRYDAKVQVYDLPRLKSVVSDYPFGPPAAGWHDYVIFMENGLEKQLMAEDCILAAGELVKTGNGVVYWRVAKGQTLKSGFAKLLNKPAYRDFNTNRNLNTLQKLLARP